MMASRVTPPVEDEGAEVVGMLEAGGATVSVYVHLGQSWASLHLTVAVSMAPIMEK